MRGCFRTPLIPDLLDYSGIMLDSSIGDASIIIYNVIRRLVLFLGVNVNVWWVLEDKI